MGGWVLLDGAHNPDGATVLAATVDELARLAADRSGYAARRSHGRQGCRRDGAVTGALSRCSVVPDFVATSVPDSDRALPATELARRWTRCTDSPAEVIDERPDAALSRALELAQRDDGLLVVADRSYLIGHVRAALLPAEVPR